MSSGAGSRAEGGPSQRARPPHAQTASPGAVSSVRNDLAPPNLRGRAAAAQRAPSAPQGRPAWVNGSACHGHTGAGVGLGHTRRRLPPLHRTSSALQQGFGISEGRPQAARCVYRCAMLVRRASGRAAAGRSRRCGWQQANPSPGWPRQCAVPRAGRAASEFGLGGSKERGQEMQRKSQGRLAIILLRIMRFDRQRRGASGALRRGEERPGPPAAARSRPPAEGRRPWGPRSARARRRRPSQAAEPLPGRAWPGAARRPRGREEGGFPGRSACLTPAGGLSRRMGATRRGSGAPLRRLHLLLRPLLPQPLQLAGIGA